MAAISRHHLMIELMIGFVFLLLEISKATTDNQLEISGRFEKVKPFTNESLLSLIESVDIADEADCARYCLRNSSCEIAAKTTNLCKIYSQNKVFGQLESPVADSILRKIDRGESTSNHIQYPEDCYELYTNGHKTDGAYMIKPQSTLRTVYCDMTNGGWTYILHRFDGTVEFHDKTWNEYKEPIGNVSGEHWYGLEAIHELTSLFPHQLRVELKGFSSSTVMKHLTFSYFKVDSESNKYKLNLCGASTTSTLNDELSIHNDVSFSSKDQDNDPTFTHHAVTRGSGWWWTGSGKINLLGPYSGDSTNDVDNANCWYGYYGNDYKGLKIEILKIKRNAPPAYPTYVVNGARWRPFWWYTAGTHWDSKMDDVLANSYGECSQDSAYCFGRLPCSLKESGSEILAVDTDSTPNIYRWSFSSSNNVAHAAWLAFHDHTQTASGTLQDGNAWMPTVVQGNSQSQSQDSFMYRTEHGVVSIMLDDDRCDCYSSLQMGHGMCGNSWSSSHGSEYSLGTDSLDDPGCNGPVTTKGLKIYFKDDDNCAGVTCPDWTSCYDGIDEYWCM